MKFKHLAVLGIAALLTIGCAREVSSNQSDVQLSPATTVATNATPSGSFKAGEHPTQGTVSIATENGKLYLELDQNFKSDDGPDLFVILHRSDAPPVYGIQNKDYVSIARLQKTSGAQRYAVPDNVKLADFKSVAIWCRKFNATFGYAPLGS